LPLREISFSAERGKVKPASVFHNGTIWYFSLKLGQHVAHCGLNLGLIWTHFPGLMMKLNALGGSWPRSPVTSFPLFSA